MPGREFTKEAPPQVIQSGQAKVGPEVLIRIAPPECVAPAPRQKRAEAPCDPAIQPIEDARGLRLDLEDPADRGEEVPAAQRAGALGDLYAGKKFVDGAAVNKVNRRLAA